jgi:hypothetical protein
MIRWLLVSWLANAIVLGIAGWILSGGSFQPGRGKWQV